MNHRVRALLAGAGLIVLLTACGARQGQTTTIELSPITPTASAPAPHAPAATPADTQTCFDVAEVYSGLELLPLTDHSEEEDADEDALEQARDSVSRLRGKLPAAVRPAFDDVRDILDDAGATLQPAEAVRIHRALEPAESWLRANCASTPRH
ncbi:MULTISPECIES: hypothetical protein [Kocuria]|uniref:Lipoprotein n=2 Tax=Kocuria marina TaxID=223184 RepID=A0A0B0DGH1_9MICC|nr:MULTISPECIES: hypothetical protein [Kocuria]KHE75262.1 hypothetical protein AS25_02340 [Kocuria marina]OXS83816.1 hypothetical protein B1B07_06080 [Kocuria indica]RLP58069.1 hypothetical protein D9R06_06485 [Kocuria indica]SMF06267.1 hypothetical protein SAMN06296028_10770 [Kocuria indica]